MPYIGNTIRAADDYRLIDDISSGFNGSETSFALQVAGSAPVPFPKSPQQVLISVNGVIQEPDPTGSSGFNLVGTNIVFSSAPTNGHAFFGIIYATADYLNAGGNFPAGSLGAPSITFIGDENTGLFRKSGGSVGFVSDATEIANFDSNGITISSGNLIIPDSIIHNGDTNTKIRFPSADTISAETAGSEALRITSTGRLGINETNPGHKLVVGGDIGVGFTTPNDAARQLNFNVNRGSAGDTLANINWQWNDKFVAQIRGIAGDDTTNKDDAELGFFTSAANSLVERLRITRNGDIGVGTSDPKTQFHILQSAVTNAPTRSAALYLENNANCEIQFVGNSSNDCQLRFGTSNNSFLGAIEYELDNANMEFYTGGSERLRILGNGRVGIGTTSPDAKLQVAGSAHITAPADSLTTDALQFSFSSPEGHIKVKNSSGAPASNLAFHTTDASGTTNRVMHLRHDGNVGIGTSSPSELLQVAGTLECNNIKFLTTNKFESSANVLEGKGTNGARLRSALSEANTPSFSNSDDTDSGMFLPGSNVLGLSTGGSEALRIDANQHVLIGQSASISGLQVGTPPLQVTHSGADVAMFRRNSNDAGGPYLSFVKERNGAIVADGDLVGAMAFLAHDGTDLDSYAAQIKVEIDGTPGANITPGALSFHTSATANRTTERFRIDSSGICEANNSLNSQYSSTTSITPHLRARNPNGLDNIYGGLQLRADRGTGAASIFNIFCLNTSTNFESILAFQSRNTDGNFTEKMRIGGTGALTIAAQPCTLVTNITSESNLTSSKNGVPITFTSTHINQGGMALANTRSRITVPVTGTYLITMLASGGVTTVEAGDGIILRLRRNGANYPTDDSHPVESFGTEANMEWAFSMNMPVNLTANDYIEMVLDNIGTVVRYSQSRGYFSATLMH